MNNIFKGIKKFSFFGVEKSDNSEQKGLKYTLDDIAPIQLKIFDNNCYIAGKLKNGKADNDLFRIFKVLPDAKSSLLVEEYIPFTDSIIDFDIINNEGKPYLVIIGTDLRNKDDQSNADVEIINGNGNDQMNKIIVKPSPNSIPSIKLFYFYNQQSNQQVEGEEKKLEIQFQPEEVIYLMHKKGKLLDIYKGNDLSGLTEVYEPISSISCFAVSPRLNAISFSIYNTLIEIKLEFNKKDKYKFSSTNTPNKGIITNIKYIISYNDCFIYLTTNNTVYFKKSGESKFSMIGDEQLHSGANPQNFDIDSQKNVIISSPYSNLIEDYFYNDGSYERQNTKTFERPIRFIQYFKRYYIFVLYEDNKEVLCIYDPKTISFATFDDSFKLKEKDILFITSNEERIYILHTESKFNKLICLKECTNKKKFDILYDKKLYDFAYNYGKIIGLDKAQLSEIAKAHAEYLYEKRDFENSIEQYKLTINYLDPNYVIKKFLEDPKKNFLIKYLEELEINEQFKNNCNSKRLIDFTALLLNCYIKTKQIEKLQNFVEKQNIKDEVIIKTTIEVCKDTNNIELALSMAKRKKMDDIYIQILIETKKDFKGSLKYISEIKDIDKKFNILTNYGEKLLENKEINEEINLIISNLIFDIINIKKEGKNDRINNLKYEKIIKVYSSKECEDKLEILLEKIIEKDPNCPNQIILSCIELYEKKYKEKEKIEKNSGNEYANKIKNILNRFKDKIDKNSLLMSFKISGFEHGIDELYKIMKLDQDLLRLYMERKDFKKINEFCRKSSEDNKDKNIALNYWQQALNYYIEISNESNNYEISEYIIEILDYLSKQEEFSPMTLLELLERASKDNNKVIEMKEIRNFFKDWIKQKKESLTEDKIKTQENIKRIEEYDKSVKDIKITAKNFNTNRCSSCRDSLDLPFIYFVCGHAYHQSCIDDNYDRFECTVCKDKNSQMFSKLEERENYIRDPSKYDEELYNENKSRKFDVFADFLGKGVFDTISNSENNNVE